MAGEPGGAGTRRQWNSAVDHSSRRELRRRGAHDVGSAPVLEVMHREAGHAVCDTRISIVISDVYISNIHGAVKVPGGTVVSPAPPWVEDFIGRQRHPADISEAKANPEANSTAEAEEADQRRRPDNAARRKRPDTTASRNRSSRTSGHSDTAPSPRNLRSPKSSHTNPATPIARFDTAPNRARLAAAKRCRNRGCRPSPRYCPNPRSRRLPAERAACCAIGQICGRGCPTTHPRHRLPAAATIWNSGSAVEPRAIIICPALTHCEPRGEKTSIPLP